MAYGMFYKQVEITKKNGRLPSVEDAIKLAEDACDAGEPNALHGDIEYLYVIDARDPNAARLICLNVRSYDWKRIYLKSRQSYRAIISAALQNGTEMARFSYPKHSI